MAAKKGSKVDKPEDSVQEVNLGEVVSAEDPVKEVILVVMKILLWEEERALVSGMNEYRNNLSRHLLIRLSELEGRPGDMVRFHVALVLRRVGRSGKGGVSSERSPCLPCC